MAESIFEDKSKAPTEAEFEKALGASASLFMNIEKHLIEKLGEIEREWKFYGKKAGWTVALVHSGRRLLHLIPRSGFFTVIITLGKKAVTASRTIGLPADIISSIEDAREYAEGRSIRLDIVSEKDVLPVKQLLSIKMQY